MSDLTRERLAFELCECLRQIWQETANVACIELISSQRSAGEAVDQARARIGIAQRMSEARRIGDIAADRLERLLTEYIIDFEEERVDVEEIRDIFVEGALASCKESLGIRTERTLN